MTECSGTGYGVSGGRSSPESEDNGRSARRQVPMGQAIIVAVLRQGTFDLLSPPSPSPIPCPPSPFSGRGDGGGGVGGGWLKKFKSSLSSQSAATLLVSLISSRFRPKIYDFHSGFTFGSGTDPLTFSRGRCCHVDRAFALGQRRKENVELGCDPNPSS